MRVSDVLRPLLPDSGGITDHDIKATCPSCAQVSTLAECAFQELAEPTYTCPKCAAVVMTIGKPGCGPGTRLGDHVLCPRVALQLNPALIIAGSRGGNRSS